MDILSKLAAQAAKDEPVPAAERAALLDEQAVLPGMCGLPRIVRAFCPHYVAKGA